MLPQLILTLLVSGSALAGQSPHGAEYLAKNDPLGRVHPDIAEDARLDVIGLLTKYGYPSETHTVQTEDGYILTMQRITGGRGNKRADKPAVLLMHGLFSSAADYITPGPHAALGYQLADEGYDVWMGNARGTFYSRNHISLDPDNSTRFWKFSWNEIGYYDLPAKIDYILETTGHTAIHYAGHSQGTTSFFVMASLRPEYNAKIRSMHALAPIAYMSNLKSPLLRFLAPYADTIELLTSLIGVNELLPNTDLMTEAGEKFCDDSSVTQPLCTNFMFLLCGYSPELMNATLLPVTMGHTPAGAASRQLVHYGQEIVSAKFRKYDHGLILNLAEYGQTTPPNYDLSKITAPVALHYSDNDWMAEVVDVEQLHSELGNSLGLFRVPHPTFNHIDFIWAIGARALLYDKVVELMRQFD